MQITKNFTYEEFYRSESATKNGINNITSDPEINSNIAYLCMHLLQPIRDKLGIPISVTSGYRCQKLNEIVGGSKTSQHTKGQAADLVCSDNKLLWDTIINSGLEWDQIINENNLSWVHVSLKKEGNRKQVLKL